MTGEVFLDVRAAFAAFRPLQAGTFRGSRPVMPPSAAYGLVLNLAGVEMRGPLDAGPTTPNRDDLPFVGIAVGLAREAESATLYQQLHGYPVGDASSELAKKTHGAKYHIAPVRREILCGYHGLIGVRADERLVARLRDGLAGRAERAYGLPFAGDNAFLFDRIDVLEQPPLAAWFVAVAEGNPGARSCRLTVSIDRRDSSRTRGALFERTEMMAAPPDSAWVHPYAPRG